jgi:hypothetical protein
VVVVDVASSGARVLRLHTAGPVAMKDVDQVAEKQADEAAENLHMFACPKPSIMVQTITGYSQMASKV